MSTGNISKGDILILSIALLFLVSVVLYGVFYFYKQNNIVPPSTAIPSALENVNTLPATTQIGPGLPVRLIIPSINVDAPIIYVGLAPDGSVDVPKGPDQVAWFQFGPRPGAKGSAVITGHYGPWRNGANSVFDNLYKLKQGDKIYVKDDKGISLTFTVRDSHIYNPNESVPEVFSKDDGTYLNLITCHGDWLANQKTYTKRLVVFTDATSD